MVYLKSKKLVSCILVAVLALSLLPISGLATDGAQGEVDLPKSKGNPVLGFDAAGTLMFGADPAAMVDGDTFYIYVGHDNSTGSGYTMPAWHAYSSTNMEDWVHEGPVMSAARRHIPWNTGNDNGAFASQPIKNFDPEMGQDFYYYYHSLGSMNCIGVAVADTPTGWSSMEAKIAYCTEKGINLVGRTTELPENEQLYFTDIGQPLVRTAQSRPHLNNFDDIDPTAWVDENGRYLQWGNAFNFTAMLNEDMISITDQDNNGLITMKTTRSLLTRDGNVATTYSATGGVNRNTASQIIERDWTYPSAVNYWDYKMDENGAFIAKTIPAGGSYPNGDIIISRHRTANIHNYQLDTPYTNDARTIVSTGDHNNGNMTRFLTYNDENDMPIAPGDTTTPKAWLNGTYNWRWNELYQTYDPSFCFYTEAPYLYRRQDENGDYYGKYYMFFGSDYSEKLAYSTTDDLWGGVWDFQGFLMACTGTSQTNHPAIADFKGQTYLIYHNGSLPFGNNSRRAVCIEEIHFNEDGSIKPILQTSTGLTGTISWIRDGNGNYLTSENFETTSTHGANNTLFTDLSSPSRAKRVDMVSKANMADELDSRWEIVRQHARVPSSDPSYVSIESWRNPGLYLRARSDNRIVLAHQNASNGNPSGMQAAAMADLEASMTFKSLAAFNGDPDAVTFESIAFPGRYLTSVGGSLLLTDGSDKDACSLIISSRAALKSITAQKEKAVYNLGEELDLDDITVTAIRHGGGTDEVEGFIADASGVDMGLAGKQTIKITYQEENFIRKYDLEIEVIVLTGAETNAASFISIIETSKNSRVWVLSFTVTEIFSDGSKVVVPYEIKISANNANVDGKYNLGDYTLHYDIKGNGSNIKLFSVTMN